MTVKQIVLSAAALLQADDIEELFAAWQDPPDGETTAGAPPADPAQDADVKTLVKSVNLAAAELSANGFPVCRQERAYAADGIIPFDGLTCVPSLVRGVQKDNVNVSFTADDRGIIVPADGEYTVLYIVQTTDKTLDEELETGAGVDINILTYLAARNYCLITGRTDDAHIWDQRYCAETENKRMARRARVRSRAWR